MTKTLDTDIFFTSLSPFISSSELQALLAERILEKAINVIKDRPAIGNKCYQRFT